MQKRSHSACPAANSAAWVSRSVKLSRALFSVPLDIAEGSGKFSNEGKKMYFSHVSRSTYDNNKLVKIRF